MNETSRAHILSWFTAALLAAQAAGGLFIPGLYRDNAWVSSVLRGTDAVALLLVVPLLLAAHAGARRGSIGWRLVWLGVLYKIFYNNLYLLFGTHYNRFFLVYVAVFIASSAAVILALLQTDAAAVAGTPLQSGRAKAAASIMFASAGILGFMWTGQSLAFVANGEVPQLVTDAGMGTHLVAALDLTTIVPLLLVGGWLLLKGHPWGRVIAPAMLVQSSLIVVDLLITPAFQAAAGIPHAWMMAPLWAAMGAGFITGAALLLGKAGAPSSPAPPSGTSQHSYQVPGRFLSPTEPVEFPC